MAASISAVAPICASAAATVQAIMAALSAGSGCPVAGQHEEEEQERERQPEQEAHMRGADRAERAVSSFCMRVAQHLAARGGNREDGPQPGMPSIPAARPIALSDIVRRGQAHNLAPSVPGVR